MRLRAVLSFVAALVAIGCGGEPSVRSEASNWPGAVAGPAGTGPGVRVFSGRAATLSTIRACTAEEGAEGDRWCVFIGVSDAGEQHLFALNVSQVIAGVPVSCDAPDANCLVLTANIGGSSADWHPTFFAGDTLVYYDQSLTPYVWRPGMEGGRLLATRDGGRDIAFCAPAPLGMGIACLALPDEQANLSVITAELYAGRVDGESEPLLSPIDSVIAGTAEDSDRVHRFDFGFPTSDHIAWSSRATPEGPEILKLQRLDDPASQITVATDVHKWQISADGSGWLWLSSANELGVGTLQTALFPDGAYPADVHAGVYDYEMNRKGSVVALTIDTYDVVSIRDPIGTPDDRVVIDSEVSDIVSLSDEGHVAYAKRISGGKVIDLLASSLDGTRACTLEASVSVSRSSVNFSPGAETLLWARSNADQYDAYHSRIADCSTAVLSPSVVVLAWLGRGHAIFIDDFEPESVSGSLRFRKIGKDGKLHPDPPTLIAEHADTYATWGPDLLLYTVSAGTDADGAYVRAFGR